MTSTAPSSTSGSTALLTNSAKAWVSPSSQRNGSPREAFRVDDVADTQAPRVLLEVEARAVALEDGRDQLRKHVADRDALFVNVANHAQRAAAAPPVRLGDARRRRVQFQTKVDFFRVEVDDDDGTIHRFTKAPVPRRRRPLA